MVKAKLSTAEIAERFKDAPWIINAYGKLGLKEVKAKGASNKEIDRMFAAVGYPDLDDDDSWCGAFSGANAIEVGLHPPIGCISGKSWETWGIKLDAPKLGCFCTSTYTALGVKDWRRHIGMVVEIDLKGKKARLIGGNQHDMVSDDHWVSFAKVTAWRWPIAATKKDLKAAGSTEMRDADILKNIAIAAPPLATVATVTEKTMSAPVIPAVTTPPVIEPVLAPGNADIWSQVSDYSDKVGIVHTFSEGAASLYGTLSANLWLLGVLVLSIGGIWIAQRWQKNRLERHKAGLPLSQEVTYAAG